ncbi:hypothetical protein B005_2805 [Nocardiopsis alba ATCC BAA-2165]|uniref:Uncharacterized protein n=1 Tax=Nocardiopsis alba (strain ATCC BAA-2165 / BE74) TaxID=1205910 RepID=J7LIU9_NOCAA|nr:hypothetical protein B005_2805 [Nocardiopsis alba ATCC BAA-2165]
MFGDHGDLHWAELLGHRRGVLSGWSRRDSGAGSRSPPGMTVVGGRSGERGRPRGVVSLRGARGG